MGHRATPEIGEEAGKGGERTQRGNFAGLLVRSQGSDPELERQRERWGTICELIKKVKPAGLGD